MDAGMDQSMVDAEQAVEPQSNDPILEERQIVVVRIFSARIVRVWV
jgi:hypothetical protein